VSSVPGASPDSAHFAGLALLRWQSWPLRQRPLRAVLALGMLLAAGIGVQWLTGRIYLAAASVAVLIVASWRFFLPVTFQLSQSGIDYWVLGRRRHIPWQSIRSYRIQADGVLLLPYQDQSLIARLNGVYVRWNGHKEQVLALLEQHVAAGRVGYASRGMN